jgi:hypothetical protein
MLLRAVAPQSMRNPDRPLWTMTQLWNLPPLPKASPEPKKQTFRELMTIILLLIPGKPRAGTRNLFSVCSL